MVSGGCQEAESSRVLVADVLAEESARDRKDQTVKPPGRSRGVVVERTRWGAQRTSIESTTPTGAAGRDDHRRECG